MLYPEETWGNQFQLGVLEGGQEQSSGGGYKTSSENIRL